MRAFKLLPRYVWDLRSSGIWRNEVWKLPTFRDNLLVRSSRVKKSISWTFSMGPIGCPETWVRNYHSTLRNMLEERRSEFLISEHVQSSWVMTLTTHVHQGPWLRRTGSTPLALARWDNFAFMDAFAKSRKDYQLRYVCPPVSPHGKLRPPVDGFLWNLIQDDFSTIGRENSTFIIVWQEWRVL